MVQLQFSKPIDPLTVTTSTFQVSTYVTGVAVLQAGIVSVSADAFTASFVPSANLSPYTTYNVNPTSGITDLEGHGLANFASSFTTGATTSSSSPTVEMVSPANGTSGVPVNARIDVVVSAPLNPATVSSSTIAMAAGAVPLSGTVSLNSAGRVYVLAGCSSLAKYRVLVNRKWSYGSGWERAGNFHEHLYNRNVERGQFHATLSVEL